MALIPPCDFISDSNPVGWHNHVDAFPAWLEEAGEFPSASDVAGLQKSAFADPDNRLHPVHTKQACYLTAAYLSGYRGVASYIVDNVKRAATAWGIGDEVEGLINEIKVAAEPPPAEAFALADGEHKFYPVGTTYDIQLSLGQWNDDLINRRLPKKQAREAALVILKRAKEEGVEPTDELLAWGAEAAPSADILKKQARNRGMLFGDEDRQQEVSLLYSDVVDAYLSSPSEENRVKAASLFDEFDAALNLSPTVTVLPADRLWFGHFEDGSKEAAARNALSFHLAGHELPVISMAAVPAAALISSFAGEAADTVKKAHAAAVAGAGSEVTELLGTLSPSLRQRLAGELIRLHP